MLVLTKGTSGNFIVTLNEKKTLTEGYYLFVFRHFTTAEIVNRIYNFLEDESSYPERYNSFPFTTEFASSSVGQWIYEIYEQASSSNTDTDGLTLVEKGVMVLNPATAFSFENYNEPTTFKQYAG